MWNEWNRIISQGGRTANRSLENKEAGGGFAESGALPHRPLLGVGASSLHCLGKQKLCCAVGGGSVCIKPICRQLHRKTRQ